MSRPPLNVPSLASTILLGIILTVGPALLGGYRLWSNLPLLLGVTVLMIVQALRLTARPAESQLRQIDAVDISVLLFVIYAAIRWLTSPAEFYSRIEVLNIVAYATIFFFCRYGLTQRTFGLGLVMLLVAIGLGEMCFGYFLHLHSYANDPPSVWYPFGPTENIHLYFFPRWIGSYTTPNTFGCLLVMATGATLALGAFSKYPWPMRIVFFYVAAVLMVGILYSGSRGSWLSLTGSIIALTVFALRYGTIRWWIPVTGVALVSAAFAAIFFFSPIVKDRLAEVTTNVQAGTLNKYSRIEISFDALRIARDHPLFGTGPATFNFVHPRYQSSTFPVRAVLTHDDYLNCLDDYGLVGFDLAMIFLWLVTLTLFNRVRSDFRWQDRVLVATGITAWFALLVHSFVDDNLHFPANAMIFFALIGLSMRRLPRESAPRHWCTFSLAPLGPWLGWAIFAFALVYGFEVMRTELGESIYESTSASAETRTLAASIDGAERALSFDPGNVKAWDLLGNLYRLRASRDDVTEDRMADGEKALDAYQHALKLNPLDDITEGQMGLAYDVLHRYAEAFFCYQAATAHQPYNGQIWNALGYHFWKRGLLVQAEEAFLRGASCPHGGEGDADAAQKVQALLDEKNIPRPPINVNPAIPQPPPPAPYTIP